MTQIAIYNYYFDYVESFGVIRPFIISNVLPSGLRDISPDGPIALKYPFSSIPRI